MADMGKHSREGDTMTLTNGHAREARDTLRAMVPFTLPRIGPASDWPQRQQQEPERDTTGPAGAARKPVDGDKVIRILTAIVVLTVAAIAAVVSYSHIFALGHAHGQDGVAARLLPLSVDGLIAAASLVMLHAARNQIRVPWLARWMLGFGVGATVAANVAYGLPFGWLGAVVSAWPAVAFVGSVEMAVRFVRDAREVATGGAPDVTADEPGTCDTGSDKEGGDMSQEPAPEQQRQGKVVGHAVGRPASRQRRQKPATGSVKARDILTRNPGIAKAEVAKRAGVSERTVERVMRDMEGTAS